MNITDAFPDPYTLDTMPAVGRLTHHERWHTLKMLRRYCEWRDDLDQSVQTFHARTGHFNTPRDPWEGELKDLQDFAYAVDLAEQLAALGALPEADTRAKVEAWLNVNRPADKRVAFFEMPDTDPITGKARRLLRCDYASGVEK